MCDTKIIEKGEVFTLRLSMEETKPRQLRVFNFSFWRLPPRNHAILIQRSKLQKNRP